MLSKDDQRTVSPREARRQLRVAASRSQVLDAAEQIFAESGYFNSTIKSIADQCEIAVGTVYTLFDDKESVFKAVVRRRGDALRDLTVATASDAGPSDATLVALADAQIRFFREHPHWARIATSLVSPSTQATIPRIGAAELYELGSRLAMDQQAAVIARGQREGVIRAGDPPALAWIFSSMLAAFHVIDVQSIVQQADYSLEEFLELVRATFTTPRPALRPAPGAGVAGSTSRLSR